MSAFCWAGTSSVWLSCPGSVMSGMAGNGQAMYGSRVTAKHSVTKNGYAGCCKAVYAKCCVAWAARYAGVMLAMAG